MATLRRGLVNKVKQVAAKVGTRGARTLVETTAAAVKTVDKLQAKLGQRSQMPRRKRAETPTAKTQSPGAEHTDETRPATTRVSGRKTMPAAAAKRTTQTQAQKKPGFKAKRGQKHLHTGR